MKLKWIIIFIVLLLLLKPQLYAMTCSKNQAIINGQCVNCASLKKVVSPDRMSCMTCPVKQVASPDGTKCICKDMNQFLAGDTCMNNCPRNTEAIQRIVGGMIGVKTCV